MSELEHALLTLAPWTGTSESLLSILRTIGYEWTPHRLALERYVGRYARNPVRSGYIYDLEGLFHHVMASRGTP